ncbi:MAG: hypothetical protein HY901_22720, partial [Deltaproteobacteria bacterium]|nr:hypothetical protein [Deltaproteobacteria bacterium]
MKLITVVLAVITLAGCSQSVCERMADNDDLQKKAEPCQSGTVTITVNKLDVAKCEEGFATCTENDSAKLEESLDCTDALSTCSPASYQDWASSFGACYAKM